MTINSHDGNSGGPRGTIRRTRKRRKVEGAIMSARTASVILGILATAGIGPPSPASAPSASPAGSPPGRMDPLRGRSGQHEIRPARSDQQEQHLAAPHRLATPGRRSQHLLARARVLLLEQLPGHAADDRWRPVQPERHRPGRGVSPRDRENDLGPAAVSRRAGAGTARRQHPRRHLLDRWHANVVCT